MKRNLVRIHTLILLVYWSTGTWLFGAPSEKIRVLFVGNSYTYADNIPKITAQLAASSKGAKKLDVEMIAPPGATLQKHWETGEVQSRLRNGKWDFVVLQEQSNQPIENFVTMQKFARILDAEIKGAGAKTVFFVTWPRREHPENLLIISNAYFNVAKELDAIIAPVGIAWMNALKEKPDLKLYHEDGSHPGPVGSYLAACVLYSAILGKNPEGLPRTLYTTRRDWSQVKAGELSKADAALIQRIAWEAVQRKVEQ